MEAEIKTKVKTEIKKPDKEISQPGELTAYCELIVRKKDGSIRERREFPSKSFVRQFLDLMLVQMQMVQELAPVQIRDISNTLRDIAMASLNFSANAAIGIDTYGIVAGTGNTAPTINDYALETQIADGVAAGELQYGNVAFGLPASNVTTSHFTITRDFANNSGGLITVEEIGLYVLGRQGSYIDKGDGAITYPFMTIRDVIAGGINVPDGDTLTVNYRLQATV